MKRVEHGRPLETSLGKVVPADIIARLSGVSLSNVSKVIAAQHLLNAEKVITSDNLTDFSRFPQALPDEERARNTEKVYDGLGATVRSVPGAVLDRLSQKFRALIQDRQL